MKRRNTIFHGILFGILMLFLFSFMAQEHLKLFKTKPLMGYFDEPWCPDFRWEWYQNGFYQKKLEEYVSQTHGFREPIIRVYHQFCWDVFNRDYVSYIYDGKERWLYYDHNIEDYYGTVMYRRFENAEEARIAYDREVRLLNKVRGVLADYDITLLTFIAPSKGIIYPEYLPPREHDTTTLDAREYYIQRFTETGMPCFDMNEYFLKMKDTCSFYLFPPTGDHWTFSCVYASDSLLRFMEQQRGIHLARIEYGNEWTNVCSIGDDQNRDLEGDLNLLRPVKFDHKFDYKERNYWITHDSTVVKPSALFIGNSFLLRTIAYLPPKEVFSDFQFWYYNKVARQGFDQLYDSVSFLNRLDYLIDADYVVSFTSSSQMYRATEGFAEDAIIQLCIGDERFHQRQQQLIDSLFHDEKTRDVIAKNGSDSLYLAKLERHTRKLMREDPEAYFPEIAGDSIPTARNPLLLSNEFWEKSKIRRQIKSDPLWVTMVQSTMVAENLNLQQAIDHETERILQGLPSLRNRDLSPEEYREILIKQMEQKIRYDKDWFEALQKEATEKGIPIDEWVYKNAAFMVDQGH